MPSSDRATLHAPDAEGRNARTRRGAGLLAALAVATSLGCAGQTAKPKEDLARKARSHYDLGVDHLQNGRVGPAIREFQASVAVSPKDAWSHTALAEAYRRKGLMAEAETHLLRALEIEPGFQPARLNLSALYVQLARYPEAIAEGQRLLADPTLPTQGLVKTLTNVGYAQLRLGQHAEARRSLEEALEYADGFWQAQLNLGILEAEEGRREQAIVRFQRVIGAKPGPLAEAEANYRIAEIYIAQGERDEALGHLAAAMERKPSGEWGKRSEEYLKLLR